MSETRSTGPILPPLAPDDGLAEINFQSAWLLLDWLVARTGMKRVVISPGSRSTPLALAARQYPGLKTFVVVDERSAGFFALGLVRGGNLPVALICTSGSAVANYFPAVCEAFQEKLPLAILSADRPAQLHGIGSNQTMPQAGIFGQFTGLSLSLSAPEKEADAPQWRKSLARTLNAISANSENIREVSPAPWQINCAFAEPLAPRPDYMRQFHQAHTTPEASPGRETIGTSGTAGSSESTKTTETQMEQWRERHRQMDGWLRGFQRPLLLLGRRVFPDDSPSVLAGRRAWIDRFPGPVIVDALSPFFGDFPREAVGGDLLLEHPAFARPDYQPDAVLHLDGPLLSKKLGQWLSQTQPENEFAYAWPNRPHPQWNPWKLKCQDWHWRENLVPEPELTARAKSSPMDWVRRWNQVSETIGNFLESGWPNTPGWVSEAHFLRLFFQQLREGGPWPRRPLVFAANSLTVRHCDTWLEHPGADFFGNRGVSGIDGNLSTALGIFQARRQPGIVLTGDLALLHDSNAGLLFSEISVPILIIVLNNNGGGIFRRLPLADTRNPFYTELFATPHRKKDFSDWAAWHDLEYQCPRGPADLRPDATAWPEFFSGVGNWWEDPDCAPPRYLWEIPVDPVKSENWWRETRRQVRNLPLQEN